MASSCCQGASLLSQVKAVPKTTTRKNASVVRSQSHDHQSELSRRSLLVGSGALLGTGMAADTLISPSDALAVNTPVSKKWELIDLPIDKEIVLLDIGFTQTDPNHGKYLPRSIKVKKKVYIGFLLGTRQTLCETFDGGKTWEPRSIAAAVDEGFNYRFNTISFNKDEGWIAGKPAILLHTSDGGKNWERIPLSSKLPGSPILITALPGEPGQAEMTTEQGAIYVTNNTAYTWTAAVQETVDATLNRTVSSGITGASYYEGFFSNIRRSPVTGDYVAVSSRGNFYMTWSPGDAFWMPHNRPVNRRVQNMGWTPDSRLWITSRGGELSICSDPGISDSFVPSKLGSRGFGLLDVGFRTAQDGFACGGSGSLFYTNDGGKNWKRERGADDVPGNLYLVKFQNENQGYILGNNKILLRYIA